MFSFRAILLLVCLLFEAVPRASAVEPVLPFKFVQMCDPQIGFTNYEADLGRLRKAVEQINRSGADFVVICGDLVNNANEKSYRDFNGARSGLSLPCYCAPGNHDLGNVPTTESLARYRKFIGKDYFSFEHKGYAFVVANTQLWKSYVEGESEKHDKWFRETLEEAAQKKEPVFVVCHYPPCEKNVDEPEAYFNLPVEKRKELFTLFHRCGVVGILAGHTHKTIIQEIEGIQMVTGETTSRNFDHRPFGYRMWEVGKTKPFKHEFVPVE